MGLWWRKAELFRVPRGKGIAFEGIHGLPSKRMPLIWRKWWPYYVLKVTGFQAGYELEFISGPVHMVFRKRITTPFVTVRIGPGPVQYWAHEYGQKPLRRCPVEKTVIVGNRSTITTQLGDQVTFT